MLFNSEQFLIFLPIVVVIYFALPNKIKYLWLLAASYFFYMCWNAKYVVLILTSTILTYVSSLLIEKVSEKKYKKWVLAACIILNLSILFYFKYANFGMDLLQKAFAAIHIELNMPFFDVMLPVGISFYTFQALSYSIDVYRGDIYAEKNFFRYALFVSFFPQLVAGPIERSKNLLKQLAEPKKFTFDNFRNGILLMLYGFFLKIVIADRVAVVVDTVYNDAKNYPGWYIIIATVLFAVQIYCDFYGYSVIAMGASRILGIKLMENFDAPYLASSVAEFWRRWHISLTSWFKDYLYIPLGGNRKGKVRKNINKMIVFLVSGLWHGASLSFVAWGGLNGLYQVLASGMMPIRDKAVELLHLDRKSFSHKLAQVVGTFILVDFSWIFFRANSLKESIKIIKYMFKVNNYWIFFDDSLYSLGLSRKNFNLMLVAILILFIGDFLKYRHIDIRGFILKQEAWFRCIFIAVCIWLVMLFGIWGPSYEAANFIYFQF